MKKLPPYGKHLFGIIQRGLAPRNSVYLTVGLGSFEKAYAFQLSRKGTLCLPPFANPADYDWPVESCDMLLIDTGFCSRSYLNDIAYYLYKANALRVRAILESFDLITFIR